MSDRPGFLARWSDRKRAAAKEDVQGATQEVPNSQETRDALAGSQLVNPPSDTGDGEAEFDVASLPSIEDLTGTSDVTAFMQKGVPDALRNAALRRVWALDPFLKDFTGPVDYGWDFNKPASIPGFSGEGVAFDAKALAEELFSRRDADSAAPADLAAPPQGEAETGEHPPVSTLHANPQEPSGDDVVERPENKDKNSQETLSSPYRRRHGGALPG